MNANSDPSPARDRSRAPTLYVIVAFKLVRALVVLTIALQVFAWLGDDLRPHFDHALRRIRLDPEAQFFRHLGDRIETITPVHEKWAAAGAVLYSALLALEAVGLAVRARWAGFLVVVQSVAVIAAGVFLAVTDPSWTVAGVVAVNAVIVAYLHANRDRLFRRA